MTTENFVIAVSIAIMIFGLIFTFVGFLCLKVASKKRKITELGTYIPGTFIRYERRHMESLANSGNTGNTEYSFFPIVSYNLNNEENIFESNVGVAKKKYKEGDTYPLFMDEKGNVTGENDWKLVKTIGTIFLAIGVGIVIVGVFLGIFLG